MRARLVSLVVRPTAPPLSVGLVIAASLIIAETLVLYPLKVVAPESALGVVYLLGVVVVAIVWRFWLAAATCVVSVLAFDFFHIPPLLSLSPTASGDWVAVTVYLVVALAASTLSESARLRAAEAVRIDVTVRSRCGDSRTDTWVLVVTAPRPRTLRISQLTVPPYWCELCLRTAPA
jgi:K+-sensing histidine kinase KdpD